MTGFNHYSNCVCGWCVSSDRQRYSIKQFRDDFVRRDAALRLEKRGVNSVASCYVVPNAQCPVCSAAVFFYANRFGSRVYFDDLGPPWPKHPCTDNSKFRSGPLLEVGKVHARPRGEIIENIADARLIGKSPEKAAWKIMRVIGSSLHGGAFAVELTSQDPENDAKFFFKFLEPWLPSEGDIVHATEKEVVFFDIDAMAPRTIPIHGRVVVPAPRDLSTSHEFVAGWIAKGETNAERISNSLNHAGKRTATGGRWTPRLVQREFFGIVLGKPQQPHPAGAKSSRKRQKRRKGSKRGANGRNQPTVSPR